MDILAFFIAFVAYLGWRLWLASRGIPWKPEGRWGSRTEDAKRYLATTNPAMVKWTWPGWSRFLFFLLVLLAEGSFFYWVLVNRKT